MTEQQPPKIEFPCPDYSIKVIGRAGPGFQDLIIEIVQKHVVDFDLATLSEQSSRNGKFISLRFRITAIDVRHLQLIHEDLMATGRVQMVI